MKTAGLALDFYDDKSGEVLKRTFPSLEELPDIVKEAHILNAEEQSVLRDDAYALILLNNGSKLRKFACVDPGNTFLSALYYVENRDKLPEEAQKVAEANIFAACDEFGLTELMSDFAVKFAAANNMGRKRDSKWQPYAGDDADWGKRTNLHQVPGTGSGSKVLESCAELKTKEANVVDVSNLEPEQAEKKAAARTAAGDRYALDSLTDVQDAIRFFEDNVHLMTPSSRHEFAVKTAARAGELNLAISEIMERYGSTTYADDVDAHLVSRKMSVPPENKKVYEELAEKRASVEPDQFVEMLAKADMETGLCWSYGKDISDPYLTTFGPSAEKLAGWSWQNGEHSVDEESLRNVNLKPHFSDDVVEAFQQDPVGIFESMPLFQKQIIADMAKTASALPNVKPPPVGSFKPLKTSFTSVSQRLKSSGPAASGNLASRLRANPPNQFSISERVRQSKGAEALQKLKGLA